MKTFDNSRPDLRPFGYAPGDYMMRCRGCDELVFDVDKRASRCLQCAEAAKRLSDIEGDPPCILRYRLIKTTRRLTFDITWQDPRTIYTGDDDGEYFKFVASNGYEVISRSRMDIQTERIWLLGAKHEEESRSGTMVFSSDEKRDSAYVEFDRALKEWAVANKGFIKDTDE